MSPARIVSKIKPTEEEKKLQQLVGGSAVELKRATLELQGSKIMQGKAQRSRNCRKETKVIVSKIKLKVLVGGWPAVKLKIATLKLSGAKIKQEKAQSSRNCRKETKVRVYG